MSAVTLPREIRKEISKLPAASRDVVAQQLRRAPPPPVLYAQACEQLALIHDSETILRKGMLAAEALALYGRMYADNRALVEAQKIKLFALRQMYKCAEELGKAEKILSDKKIPSHRIGTGKFLASYPDKKDMDDAADALANAGRIDWLVGRVERNSPLHREIVAANEKQHRDSELALRQARTSPEGVFNNASSSLSQIRYSLGNLSIDAAVHLLPEHFKKRLRKQVGELAEFLDEIDQRLGAS